MVDILECPPLENDWHCCSADSPCGEGEGDCEAGKGHCKDGLVCGQDNCRAMYGGNTDIDMQMDCCYKPGM